MSKRSIVESLMDDPDDPDSELSAGSISIDADAPPENLNRASTASTEDDGFLEGCHKGQSNIMVCVRMRPLSRREKIGGSKHLLRVLKNKVVVVLNPTVARDDFLRLHRSREKRYAFDYAFDDTTNQVDVYNHTTRFLISGVLKGYNATVFAYGSTGAGKTYTMSGTPSNPGIMVHTFQDLFHKAGRKEHLKMDVTLCYLEIYNEVIRDLLVNVKRKPLDLREDREKGIVVAGISMHSAKTAHEVMRLLQRGNRNRTTEATDANKHSSRSHAILQIIVKCSNRSADVEKKVTISKLNLIDLAGSERASVTKNRGHRLLEGANINRSLLALANCINGLVNGHKHICYRNSKLTRLLKDSLGGNCRTVMIANVSPCSRSYEDTVNTLKYANRAKNIKTKVEENIVTVNRHITEYSKVIKELRDEVEHLKRKLRERAEEKRRQKKKRSRRSRSHSDKLTPNRSGASDGDNPLLSMAGEPFSDTEMTTLVMAREQMMNKFSKLINLKKELINVEDEYLKLTRTNSELLDDLSFMDGEEDSSGIDQKQQQLKLIQSRLKDIKREKIQLKDQLMKIREGAETFRANIPSLISNNRVQKVLEWEYRVHCLQLDKMDLEDSALLYQDVLMQKDLSIKRLIKQVEVRDQLLQKKVDSVPKTLGLGTINQAAFGYDDFSIRRVLQSPPIPRQNSWVLPPPKEWSSACRKEVRRKRKLKEVQQSPPKTEPKNEANHPSPSCDTESTVVKHPGSRNGKPPKPKPFDSGKSRSEKSDVRISNSSIDTSNSSTRKSESCSPPTTPEFKVNKVPLYRHSLKSIKRRSPKLSPSHIKLDTSPNKYKKPPKVRQRRPLFRTTEQRRRANNRANTKHHSPNKYIKPRGSRERNIPGPAYRDQSPSTKRGKGKTRSRISAVYGRKPRSKSNFNPIVAGQPVQTQARSQPSYRRRRRL